MKNIVLLIVLLFLTACTYKSEPLTYLTVKAAKSINTNDYLPSSYLLSSKASQEGDSIYYYDQSVSSIIILNNQFDLIGKLDVRIGTGPDQIDIYVSHTTTKDGIWITGANEILLYNRLNLEFINKYKFDDLDVQWVKEFNDQMYLGGYNYNKIEYGIFELEFDQQRGLKSVQSVAEIEFPENLDELTKTTIPVVMGQDFFILKLEIGHLVKFDLNFQQQYDIPLPFRIPEKENYVEYEDGSIDLDYYESWDLTARNDSLYVLRHFDLIEKRFSEDIVNNFRRTVQIYNSDGEILGVVSFPQPVRFLSFIDNKLMAIDEDSEQYILYEISN